MKRDTRSAYRARAAKTERDIDAGLAEAKAARESEQAELAAAYAEKNKAVPYTPEELKAARAIRTHYGWHRVIRVNRSTVTLSGDFGDWRTPLKNVLEVRWVRLLRRGRCNAEPPTRNARPRRGKPGNKQAKERKRCG